MKRLILIFLFTVNIYSQKVIVPVEEKGSYLTGNHNLKNYEFKDVNKVFEKFKGKWIYKDSIHQLNLDINTYYCETNQQDAVYIKMLFIKYSDTLINTLNYKDPKYSIIKGGFFQDTDNINTIFLLLSDIIGNSKRTILLCDNENVVNLAYLDSNQLKWNINKNRGSSFTKTAQLLPKNIVFTKLEN